MGNDDGRDHHHHHAVTNKKDFAEIINKNRNDNDIKPERYVYIPGSCHGSHMWRSISIRVPLRTSSFVIFL